MKDYEIVVGLEIHVQLDTQTKMFCDCAVVKDKNAEPNISVCQTCMGFPGTLPVVNRGAVERAVLLAKALGCTINQESFWDRKHYFYPDLTKGYQITQYEKPFAEGGELRFKVESDSHIDDQKVSLERIHLEEDTGKSFHADGNTYIDFNRAGTPLVEIVTKPDIRGKYDDEITCGDKAKAFLEELQFILQNEKYEDSSEEFKISRAKLEEGNMRFDVNISVRKIGAENFGTKQEIKNLNSLQAVKDSIDIQAKKQVESLENSEAVIQSTWTFNDATRDTVMLRSKEEAHDYRYFREPDLPNLVIENELKNKKTIGIGEKAESIFAKYSPVGGMNFVRNYLEDPILDLDEFVRMCSFDGGNKHIMYTNFSTIYYKYLKKYREKIVVKKELFLDGIVYLMKFMIDGKLNSMAYDQVVVRMFEDGIHPKEFISEYVKNSDTSELEKWVDEAISENPSQWQEYKAGKEVLEAFFIGQVMKKSKGKADAKVVMDILKTK